MTLPLKYTPVIDMGIEFKMVDIAGELELLSYNLRKRYAADLDLGRVGSIGLGTNNIGSAASTERGFITQTNPHSFPSLTSPTVSNTFNYRQNLNIPTTPVDFTHSYAQYSFTTTPPVGQFRQETDLDRIHNNIIAPCIEEMINGDGIGTYRVSTTRPTDGTWSDKDLFFRDGVYLNFAGHVNYNLWLKIDDAAPSGALPLPEVLRVIPEGFKLQATTAGSPFETVMYAALVRSLARDTLRYTVGTTAPTGSVSNRGEFMDTQFGVTPSTLQSGPDDYRTTITPAGPAAEFETYYLGLS